MASMVLYIVRFLHQTTTIRIWGKICLKLYIVRFLHQTTTFVRLMPMPYPLYIVRFLHQTTTILLVGLLVLRCISSVSYIKPQPQVMFIVTTKSCISSVSYIKPQLYAQPESVHYVVYRPFPTSNHNLAGSRPAAARVVYRPFPTSNHNSWDEDDLADELYIVRFLHQTTTCVENL